MRGQSAERSYQSEAIRRVIVKKKFSLCAAVIGAACAAVPAWGQVATGGAYTLDQAVIANGGGGPSTAGNYGVTGTAGQAPIANSNGPQYAVRGGFWSQAPLAPTAALAGIGGRVVRDKEIGIKGVVVELSGGTLSSPRRTLTNNMGYFTFDDIEVGQSYFLTVTSKKYSFANGTRAFTLMDSVFDLVFVASWENP